MKDFEQFGVSNTSKFTGGRGMTKAVLDITGNWRDETLNTTRTIENTTVESTPESISAPTSVPVNNIPVLNFFPFFTGEVEGVFDNIF